MMSDEQKFKKFESDLPASDKEPFKASPQIIKGKAVQMRAPVKIDNQRNKTETKKKSTVTPIIENDEIVGVIFQCVCGERSEIMFELADKPE